MAVEIDKRQGMSTVSLIRTRLCQSVLEGANGVRQRVVSATPIRRSSLARFSSLSFLALFRL